MYRFWRREKTTQLRLLCGELELASGGMLHSYSSFYSIHLFVHLLFYFIYLLSRCWEIQIPIGRLVARFVDQLCPTMFLLELCTSKYTRTHLRRYFKEGRRNENKNKKSRREAYSFARFSLLFGCSRPAHNQHVIWRSTVWYLPSTSCLAHKPPPLGHLTHSLTSYHL